jgi:hypothetical protein
MKSTRSSILAAALGLALAFTFGCSDDKDDGGGKVICTDEQSGCVPSSVIPESIRVQFENIMPIYSGTNPPDISGQYLSKGQILVGSSLSNDIVGSHYSSNDRAWADKYYAFIREADGKLSYKSKNGSSQGQSDEVTVVEIVGNDGNFTAYFFESDVDNNSRSKSSVLISGTLTSSGISDYHYAFIMLEKDDPQNKLVEVGTYRIFKDGDGLAERHNWID